VMSNHRSTADIAVLLANLPFDIRFMAKRELGRIPIFGWAMALGGHLLVDRGNRALVKQSLERGVELLRQGKSVVVFPEGSRGTAGDLGAFKSGGFQLALDAGAPILPVSIEGSEGIAGRGSLEIRGGRVRVRCGEPIATAGDAPLDRSTLKKVVREAILQGLGPERQEGAAPEA